MKIHPVFFNINRVIKSILLKKTLIFLSEKKKTRKILGFET